MIADEAVKIVLTEKIRHLEHRISELEAELVTAGTTTLDATLGQLRLREIALTYFGTLEHAFFIERLKQDLGAEVSGQVLRHLFILDRASLPEAQRQALRAAFNGGICRW